MAAAPDTADPSKTRRWIDWIDDRFPLTKLWKS
jgi:hypothetical protein